MSKIRENIHSIKEQMQKFHKNSIFAKSPVPKLVAVSKKQEDYKIIEALEMGQKYFGENRVQEAQQRWVSKLKNYENIELRLIGPLQTNKIKQALNLFDDNRTSTESNELNKTYYITHSLSKDF